LKKRKEGKTSGTEGVRESGPKEGGERSTNGGGGKKAKWRVKGGRGTDLVRRERGALIENT